MVYDQLVAQFQEPNLGFVSLGGRVYTQRWGNQLHSWTYYALGYGQH